MNSVLQVAEGFHRFATERENGVFFRVVDAHAVAADFMRQDHRDLLGGDFGHFGEDGHRLLVLPNEVFVADQVAAGVGLGRVAKATDDLIPSCRPLFHRHVPPVSGRASPSVQRIADQKQEVRLGIAAAEQLHFAMIVADLLESKDVVPFAVL